MRHACVGWVLGVGCQERAFGAGVRVQGSGARVFRSNPVRLAYAELSEKNPALQAATEGAAMEG